MASHSPGLAVSSVPAITGRSGLIDRYFYFAMSLLVMAISIYGFSQTISQNLLHPAVPRPFLLWIHAAVFTAWLVLFIVQSGLVRLRQVSWHRTLGWLGLIMGATMPFLGAATAVVMDRFRIHQLNASLAEGSAFIILQWNDMLLFGIFFALAAYWRRKPQLHRRLMLIATCGLTTAAFGRFPSYAIQNDYFYVCVDLLITLGILRDLAVDRRIHKVYLYALPALAIEQSLVMFTYLNALPWWVHLGHRILA